MIQPRETIGAPEDAINMHYQSYAHVSSQVEWFIKCESQGNVPHMNTLAIARSYGNVLNADARYHIAKKYMNLGLDLGQRNQPMHLLNASGCFQILIM